MLIKSVDQFSLVKISSFFLCFIPIALLTGPFLPDLLLSCIALFILFEIFRHKFYFYLQNNFFYVSIFFYVYFVIRSILSLDPLLSLESSLFYCRFIFFAIAVWYLIDNNKQLINNFTYSLLLSFIIALLDGYFQFFNNTNFFGIESPSLRMTLLLNDKLILGGYLARLFPLLLGLILINFKNNYLNIFLFCSLLILTDILIFITGERTALALLFLSSLFIIIFISQYKLIRIITITVSIILMIIISLLDSDIKNRNIDTTLRQVGITNESKEVFIFSEIHQSHFISAYKMFLDNPLFGHGPKMYRNLCEDEKFKYDTNSCSTHPHNLYIQLMAETGIVGVIFLLLISVYILSRITRHIISNLNNEIINLNDFQLCLIACFVMTLWPIAPTNNFFNNWINVVYYLPVGFYLHSIYSKKI